VRKANVFVSHAWKYKFLDVVDALKSHFNASEEMDSVVIWFDLFSNNQNSTEDIPFEWWCGTFHHSIKRIGRTVAVFLPWENPIPLTRVWCLWGIFISQKTKVRFEIAMSPHEEIRLIDMISRDPDVFNTMLSNIDVEKSDAFKPSDKENIFHVTRSTVGFHQVNKGVIECIRTQLLNRMKATITSPSSTKFSKESQLQLMRGLILILKDMGDYDSSLEYASNYLTVVRQLYGSDHGTSFDACCTLGGICLNLGYVDAAVQCLESVANRITANSTIAKSSLILLRTQRLLGAAYLQLGHADLARIIVTDCVEQGKRLDMIDLQCMLAVSDLGNVYYKLEEPSKAAELCDEAISMLTSNGLT
jgi:hypothetical protein